MAGRESGVFVPRKAEIEPFASTRNKEVVVFPKLTKRQKEVLILTAQGLSKKDIAEKLCLQIRTIDRNRSYINNAFGTNGMFWSVIEAARIDILDVSELTKDFDKQALEKLSKRELEVLESLANGINYKETAETLSLDSTSVSRIFISARKKLRLNSHQSMFLYMDAKKRDALPPKEYGYLKDKDKEIFKLTTLGHSRKQISEILNITQQSVHSLEMKIFKSFDSSRLTELLIKLVDKKLIDPHKYIEDVKKADNNFLKNLNTVSDISSLLSEINEKDIAVLNAFVTSRIKGGTNKEIADFLGNSEPSVESRFGSISKKLGRAKREHIAMWYLAARSAEGE